MTNDFIDSVLQQLLHYKELGEKTFAQLNDKQLLWQYNEESNSVGILVKHLWGNMLSRWTDFFTTDGEKEWRKRDAEFENDIKSREELMQKWTAGWMCLLNAVNSLRVEDLSKPLAIRGKALTVTDALIRQLAHTAYHVGQIVYLGKMQLGEKWETLSIPAKKHQH